MLVSLAAGSPSFSLSRALSSKPSSCAGEPCCSFWRLGSTTPSSFPVLSCLAFPLAVRWARSSTQSPCAGEPSCSFWRLGWMASSYHVILPLPFPVLVSGFPPVSLRRALSPAPSFRAGRALLLLLALGLDGPLFFASSFPVLSRLASSLTFRWTLSSPPSSCAGGPCCSFWRLGWTTSSYYLLWLALLSSSCAGEPCCSFWRLGWTISFSSPAVSGSPPFSLSWALSANPSSCADEPCCSFWRLGWTTPSSPSSCAGKPCCSFWRLGWTIPSSFPCCRVWRPLWHFAGRFALHRCPVLVSLAAPFGA